MALAELGLSCASACVISRKSDSTRSRRQHEVYVPFKEAIFKTETVPPIETGAEAVPKRLFRTAAN
jgi:hypothetical protein